MIEPTTLKAVLVRERILPDVARRARMTYAQVYHVLSQDPPAKPGHRERYARRLAQVQRAAKAVLQARMDRAVKQHQSIIDQL